MMSKPVAILAALLLSTTILSACSEEKPPSQQTDTSGETEVSESERLNTWFQDLFEEDLARSPQQQTYRGLKTNYDKWDDISDTAIDALYQRARERLAKIKTFDFKALDDEAKLSYRIFERNQEDFLAGEKWRNHSYRITQSGGVHTSLTQLLTVAHRIDTVEDAAAYITRVKTVDQPLALYTQRIREQVEMGIMPPAFSYPMIIATLENMLKGQPFEEDATDDSLLMADFKGKIAGLDLTDEEKQALERDLTEALLIAYGPSMSTLLDLTRDMQAKATTDDGIWKLPDGGSFYNYRLAMMTTTDLTSDQIHDIGLAQVARIHGEMQDLIEIMGFSGTLQDYFDLVRTDDRFYYPDTDEGRASYVEAAQAAQDRAYARVPDFFNLALKDKLEVRPVEKYREGGSPLAFYQPPAEDGSRPGIYYVNTRDMHSLPTYQLESIAFHEGIPGHHYQMSIAQNLDDLPEFRQGAFYFSYVEGWGLYAERLSHEMGLFSSDESEFGRLTLELWRAMRMVADTGLHARKWTRQETIDYMVENSPMDRVNITTEVERYVTWPGQATTYMVGMLKILELRDHAKEELGDAFDIRAFHDVILKDSQVPLSVLAENVETYIEKTKADNS